LKNPDSISLPAIYGRLRSAWTLKLLLVVLLNLWIYVPYHWLQQHHLFQPTAMPASFLDRMIPFSDKAVWLYLSIYVLTPIGPFLMDDRRQIIRYAVGVGLIGLLADFVFIFWPTSCARPGANGTLALYRLLTTCDNPCHAFPSLHAAFAVYSALCAEQVLRTLHAPKTWRNGIWLWTFLILLATLLTKQHMVADIAAGSVLGLGAYVCVFAQWNFTLAKKTRMEIVTHKIRSTEL
jgi:hypothetical protein